mgnify:CR=1 FL=1
MFFHVLEIRNTGRDYDSPSEKMFSILVSASNYLLTSKLLSPSRIKTKRSMLILYGMMIISFVSSKFLELNNARIV